MEIIGAILGLFFVVVTPPSQAESSPYVYVKEYRTYLECKAEMNPISDICIAEPERYLGTRKYTKIGISQTSVEYTNTCTRVEGCEVDTKADSMEDYCPTCDSIKWYEKLDIDPKS